MFTNRKVAILAVWVLSVAVVLGAWNTFAQDDNSTTTALPSEMHSMMQSGGMQDMMNMMGGNGMQGMGMMGAMMNNANTQGMMNMMGGNGMQGMGMMGNSGMPNMNPADNTQHQQHHPNGTTETE